MCTPIHTFAVQLVLLLSKSLDSPTMSHTHTHPPCRRTSTSEIVAAWPRTPSPEGATLAARRVQNPVQAGSLMFTIHTRRCLDYVGDSVQACNSDPARTRLRSASSSDYTVPRTRTKFGDRAFSVAGPVVWNSLPAAVREVDSLHSFRRKLKTHLFTLCFNDWLTVFRLL